MRKEHAEIGERPFFKKMPISGWALATNNQAHPESYESSDQYPVSEFSAPGKTQNKKELAQRHEADETRYCSGRGRKWEWPIDGRYPQPSLAS